MTPKKDNSLQVVARQTGNFTNAEQVKAAMTGLQSKTAKELRVLDLNTMLNIGPKFEFTVANSTADTQLITLGGTVEAQNNALQYAIDNFSSLAGTAVGFAPDNKQFRSMRLSLALHAAMLSKLRLKSSGAGGGAAVLDAKEYADVGQTPNSFVEDINLVGSAISGDQFNDTIVDMFADSGKLLGPRNVLVLRVEPSETLSFSAEFQQ